ncbi:MAG: LacI family DNA-binding transcriptional regulator [Armatimonadetes bacterium]|nr:LacI family DNA-binding transcriptional regulator [Armatimonadota bacterium]
MARITQRDIAQLCGLDTSTVSRSLQGDERIHEATRARVVDAARRLGYRPNLAARALVGGRAQVLWLVLASVGATADWRTTHAVTSATESTDYDLFVALHGNDEARYERLLARLAQGLVDGAVVLPRRHVSDERLLRELALRDYPLVLVDVWIDGLPVPAVTTDNDGASRLLARRCAEAGARGFVLLYGDNNPVVRERTAGARAELAALGLPWTEIGSVDDAWQETEPWPDGPLAMLASAQETVLAYCRRNAGRLADRRLVAGCFDEWRGEPSPADRVFVAPQDHDAIARQAVRLLARRVECPNEPTERRVMVQIKPIEEVVPRF